MTINKILCLLVICAVVVVDQATSSSLNRWPVLHSNDMVYWSPKGHQLDCITDTTHERSWPPKDYELVPNLGYYKLHAFGTNWVTARQVCEEEGAHLVIVNSAGEAEAIKTLMTKHQKIPESLNKDHVWMGVHERGVHGKFFTIFGDRLEDVGYLSWSKTPQQPNDPTPDDCVSFYKSGAMYDDACNIKYGFICEIEQSLVVHKKASRMSLDAPSTFCNGKNCKDSSTTSIHWPTINNNPFVNWSPKPQLLDCLGNPAERSWPPSDYELCPDLGYYKLHAFGTNWHTARQVCEEEGAHLVIVNSPAESDFLKKLMAKYPKMPESTNKDHVWMGIHERGTHGKFFTIFGDKLEDTGFVNWNPKQPNDPNPDDCATFYVSGVLFDDPCNVKYGFVCEIELSLASSVIDGGQLEQVNDLVCNDRVCPHVETDSEKLAPVDDIGTRGSFGSSGGGSYGSYGGNRPSSVGAGSHGGTGSYGGSGGPAGGLKGPVGGLGGPVGGSKPITAGTGSYSGSGGPAVGHGGPVGGNKPIAAGTGSYGGSGGPAGGLGGPVGGSKPITAGAGSYGGSGGPAVGHGSPVGGSKPITSGTGSYGGSGGPAGGLGGPVGGNKPITTGTGSYGGSGGPAGGLGGPVGGSKPITAGAGSYGGSGGPAGGLGGPVGGSKPITSGTGSYGGSGGPAGGLGGPLGGSKPITTGVGSHGGVGSYGGAGGGSAGYGSGGYDDSLPQQKAIAPISDFYWPETSYGSGRGVWSPQARRVECATSPADCTWPPKDYELYTNMGYYKFYAYGTTWSLARETCQEDGAHLVILNSEKEATVVRNLSMKYPTSVGASKHDHMWVGVHERGAHGEFYTIFGDKLRATGFWRWCQGEPGDKGLEDCVLIKPGGLADWPCDNKFPFICEIELSQVDARRRMLNTDPQENFA